MCRLFGLSAAPARVRATFWLLDASDSLVRQSRRNPDGTGLGTFDVDGQPRVQKQPIAAYRDEEFAREAKECESATFLAHVRYASTGATTAVNTHPFTQHGRLFAHNGVIGGLDRLDAELGEYRELVGGDTDSERLFALVTKYADERGGDVAAAIAAAAGWVADNLPVYAINFILTTPDQLWALRYPETHELFVLERAAGGTRGSRHLEQASGAGRIRARSGDLAARPAVTVASECMDEDPNWQPIPPGVLVHVGPDLAVTYRTVLDHPPRHRLTIDDLDTRAAASQTTR
ncbi:class II glutamine amidotransferase [Nocardia pseudobrasiliensis]|uniref:Glutamine amidotransferase n=1 Tax=Nocardia pseudobrasiliensis TaxID=45979 RepID=A0A370IBB2_9NOCA|nr:class II glutamine amidotransferase [Nocardia pseudobrasiliensis]RDI67998.1 glutamine amidotransferase [Nocardia pseudobrasiliensis]